MGINKKLNFFKDPLSSEFLRSFPRVLDEPDILNGVRMAFNYARENMKREERLDNYKCRQTFVQLFRQICYPLMHHATIPSMKLHDHEAIEGRQVVIDRVAKQVRRDMSIDFLLNDNEKFEPFNMDEIRFDILAN